MKIKKIILRDMGVYVVEPNQDNFMVVKDGRLAIIEVKNEKKKYIIGVEEKFKLKKECRYYIKSVKNKSYLTLNQHINIEKVRDMKIESLFENIDDYYFGYEDRYDTVYKAGAHLWETDSPNQTLVNVFAKYPNLFKNKVIDLGCGEGRDSIYLKKNGVDVYGVDISHTAIKKAKERISMIGEEEKIFQTGNVLYLNNFQNEDFDLAINMGCLHMINKLEDRKLHLENVNRVLKRGGHFLVEHCNSEWGKGFRTIDNYYKVKDMLINFQNENYIDRIINVKGRDVKIPLKVIPYLERSNKDLIQEINSFGFKLIENSENNDETFGSSSLLLFEKL